MRKKRGFLRYIGVRKKIQKKIEESPEKQAIGDLREKKVLNALVSLKKKGLIRDFIKTGKLSYPDVMLGIDFYCIFVGKRYQVCSFSVTGAQWEETHFEKHPEIPIVVIDTEENQNSIEKKILNLRSYLLKEKRTRDS